MPGLLDADGRRVRRAIGFLREYVRVEEPKHEGDLVLVADKEIESEDDSLITCCERGGLVARVWLGRTSGRMPGLWTPAAPRAPRVLGESRR
jgi:hypothetical protein